MANPLSPPGDLKINGVPEKDELSTHKMHRVEISAAIRQSVTNKADVRLVVYLSKTKSFAKSQVARSGWGGTRRASVSWDNLDPNTRYWVRAHVEQRNLSKLSDYNSANFWTERPPAAPSLTAPSENVTVINGVDVTLKWDYRDADRPQDAQSKWQVRWRVPATSVEAAGPWSAVTDTGAGQTYTISANHLKANTFYEWTVRTQDVHSSMWGDWARSRSFYITGSNRPPRLLSPIKGEAVSTDEDVTFEWLFRDPQKTDYQVKADLQFRVQGTSDWTTLFGDTDNPGGTSTWVISPPTLLPDFKYEWQLRTYDSSDPTNPSDWSESEFFHTTKTPGWAISDTDIIASTVPQGSLGEGTYRVMVYERGGQRLVGEIKPIRTLQWSRVRDDISSCLLNTNGFSADCCAMLGSLRTWAHEVVVFRDGDRVWEGPITRISDLTTSVEIEARDPMVYVYRRIMRQGYNDRFVGIRDKKTGKIIGGKGPRTVVDRAAIIIQNALAPNDPNVLPYLTRFDFADDAQESRAVSDWQKTAWEEVDDMAAVAGLDYTTVGRRIILNDTHRAIGRLAEMRDTDFFTPPVITEYGMSAANVFGVSSDSGLHGEYSVPIAERADLGPIEMLASAYGESATKVSTPLGAMTPAQRAEKVAVLNRQAARNISGRWPPPLVVRVPDNSRLHPDTAIGINQLVPGVWVPLRANGSCRSVTQVQKLDSVTVTVDATGEQVQVVMSPAPRPGLDPDAGDDGTSDGGSV